MFGGAETLAVNHLPLERGLAIQKRTLNRKPDGKALVTSPLDVRGLLEINAEKPRSEATVKRATKMCNLFCNFRQNKLNDDVACFTTHE